MFDIYQCIILSAVCVNVNLLKIEQILIFWGEGNIFYFSEYFFNLLYIGTSTSLLSSKKLRKFIYLHEIQCFVL